MRRRDSLSVCVRNRTLRGFLLRRRRIRRVGRDGKVVGRNDGNLSSPCCTSYGRDKAYEPPHMYLCGIADRICVRMEAGVDICSSKGLTFRMWLRFVVCRICRESPHFRSTCKDRSGKCSGIYDRMANLCCRRCRILAPQFRRR